MPRAIWDGAITFGLVEIPISVVSAEQSKKLSFHLLDKKNFAPIRYVRVNEGSGEEVDWEDIVKGYPYEKDEYVVLTDEDFKRANPKASKTIEIFQFVDPSEIDSIYFAKPYYLSPKKKNSKSYSLLIRSLSETKKAALAKIVLRTREHIAIIKPFEGVLLLQILRYTHELRSSKDVASTDESAKQASVKPAEAKMAKQFITSLTASFKPEKYKDTYYDDLMKFIESKAERGESHLIETESEGRESFKEPKAKDLTSLLRKSLERATNNGREARVSSKRRKKPGRKAA